MGGLFFLFLLPICSICSLFFFLSIWVHVLPPVTHDFTCGCVSDCEFQFLLRDSGKGWVHLSSGTAVFLYCFLAKVIPESNLIHCARV